MIERRVEGKWGLVYGPAPVSTYTLTLAPGQVLLWTWAGVDNLEEVAPPGSYRAVTLGTGSSAKSGSEAGSITPGTPPRVRTSYYYLGGQRVGMRTGEVGQAGDLYYLHVDHLGSVSETTSATGGRIAQERYYPYGRVRWGSAPTSYNFTGQRLDQSTGLLFFQARYYDPRLARFVSADAMVPQPYDPQTLNRYSYTLNSPLKYTDPSGHRLEAACVQCLNPTTIDWPRAIQMAEELAVAAPPVAVAVGVGSVVMAGGLVLGYWAAQDLGPSYPMPAEYDPSNPVGATYPLPESSTLTIESTLPVAPLAYPVSRGLIGELAAHVAMSLDLPSVGGFSPEGMGHDPKGKRPEGIRKIVREIRDRLQDIQKGLGRSSNLQEYLESHAKELRLDPGDIKNLIDNLQNLGYSVESFPYVDEAVAQQVVELLQQMGVMPPP